MIRKRPVILGETGQFIKELKEIPQEDKLLEGQKLILYPSPSGLGYRADMILEEIVSHSGGALTFNSTIASYLLIQVLWDRLNTGRDQNGEYVDVLGRKFYSNYLALSPSGRSLWRAGKSVKRFQTKIPVGGLSFNIDTLTMCYLLFHFTGEINLLEKGYLALLRTEDSEVISEEVHLVEIGKFKASTKILLKVLLDRNLLIRGNLTYYSLVGDLEIKETLKNSGGQYVERKVVGT